MNSLTHQPATSGQFTQMNSLIHPSATSLHSDELSHSSTSYVTSLHSDELSLINQLLHVTSLSLTLSLTNELRHVTSLSRTPDNSDNGVVESESYVTTDGQSASLTWNKALIWGLRPDLYYYQTVAGLLMWGTLSDERTGLSFTIAGGPRRRSHSRVRVPWNSR
jgi:hypothetical protein